MFRNNNNILIECFHSETTHDAAARIIQAIIKSISIAIDNPDRQFTSDELSTLIHLIGSLCETMSKEFDDLYQKSSPIR